MSEPQETSTFAVEDDLKRSTDIESGLDIEDGKQQPQIPRTENEFLVQWDGETDPLNPRSYSLVRKWLIIAVVSTGSLLVTCASSLYTATYEQLEAEFHCSEEVATLGLTLFVVGLAVGPMFVSPLSEFYGRRPIYTLSMIFFLIFLVPEAAAQNIQTMIVGRFLDGLAGSAFLSVAAGTVSDLFAPHEIQKPMMAFTLMPFVGPVLGPLIGGFINQFSSWRWSFYVLIIWAAIQLVCLIFVPETFHPVLLARKAAAVRKETGNSDYYSASELVMRGKTVRGAVILSLYRPFQLLVLEPMCLSLCTYTALLLGILYLFFGAFPLVFATNHGFNLWQSGLTFLGLLVGSMLAVLSNPLWHKNYIRMVKNWRITLGENKDAATRKPEPEFRLPPAICGGILVPAGLFWFGWTTYSSIHWIVPILGSILFGAGMTLAFSGVWTFLVDAYPSYAASAMAANVFLRCMFAGGFPLFGNQMFNNLGFQWASSLLAFLTLALLPFPYLFFKYGKVLRGKSRFAQG